MLEKIEKESSNIGAWEYDRAKEILLVTFKGKEGKTSQYAYFGVPTSVHEGAKLAESLGTYHNKVVKKGGYSYKKVATP